MASVSTNKSGSRRITDRNVIGIHPGCGGVIRIKDWRIAASEFRFEAHCVRCGVCDPNGWGSRAECKSEAAKYFRLNPRPA